MIGQESALARCREPGEPMAACRRSSATRELYLTKYYFYQHRSAGLGYEHYDYGRANDDDGKSQRTHSDTDAEEKENVDNDEADEDQHGVENVYQSSSSGCVNDERQQKPFNGTFNKQQANDADDDFTCLGKQSAKQNYKARQEANQAQQAPARCSACRSLASTEPAKFGADAQQGKRESPSSRAEKQRESELARQQVKGSQVAAAYLVPGGGHSDNSSLVSGCTTVSPSNSISQQRSTGATSSTTAAAGATRISSNSNTCSSQRSLDQTQHQHAHSNQQETRATPATLHKHTLTFLSRLKQRRNSSPNFGAPTAQAHKVAQQRQPSIEEQLRRLLDIGPAENKASEPQAANFNSAPSKGRLCSSATGRCWHSSADNMKKSPIGRDSGKFGAGQDHRQAEQRHYYQAQQQQQQFQARQSRSAPNISPDDRLMIFMLASRSTSSNSPVERNARILKWLHNCKSAG